MTTPALARATEALRLNDGEDKYRVQVYEEDARAAVSAALHDPDDPDALAKVLARRDPRPWWKMTAATRDAYRIQADDLRAEVLGGDQ